MNDATVPAVWFVGDLSDPWVVAIAEVLAGCADIMQVHCAGELAERPFDVDKPPALLVVHRQRITPRDAQQLKEYRISPVKGDPSAIVLCVGPYVRYDELERWSSLADLVISEATAAEVLPRHVKRIVGRPEDEAKRVRPTELIIEVVSHNHDLRQAIVDACAGTSLQVLAARDLECPRAPGEARTRPQAAAPRPKLTIWDVPLLEPDWSQRLERRARLTGPVIALLGFADRESVTVAKACGAVACLELPYNVDDLCDVIVRVTRDRLPEFDMARTRTEPPHHLPPPPSRRKRSQEAAPGPVPWSDRARKPRVD